MVAMSLNIAAAIALLPTSGASLTFDQFVQQHNRSYQHGSSEYDQRRAYFNKRVEAMHIQNSNPARTWTAAPNKFWDWSDAETQTLRGWDGSSRPESSSRGIRPHNAAFLQQKSELPDEKMWSNLVTTQHVKNQGDCGSCWAIATSTVLEAHNEIYSGKYRTFSAQQIVMCTPNPKHCGGDGGCKGATAELGMEWVLKNGCAEASAIPYTAEDGQCTMGSPTADMAKALSTGSALLQGGASFGMTGWETLPKNKYEPLARALAERGPVAVSVAADAWFNYDSGIFNGCGKDAVIDHAVTAIGYGSEDGKKYWTIQNSWGADWGEQGHIRLERHDKDEYCGMNNDPQKGVACQGETTPVPVCGMCGVLFDSVVPHFG